MREVRIADRRKPQRTPEEQSLFDLALRLQVDLDPAVLLARAPRPHAKNYSLLLDRSDVRFAPLYDIASAVAYPELYVPKLRLAMRIGDEHRLAVIAGRHWRRLAAAFELDEDIVVTRVASLADAHPTRAPKPFALSIAPSTAPCPRASSTGLRHERRRAAS